MTAHSDSPFTGAWHIVSMSGWDQDYVNMEVPGHFTFGKGHSGSFQFGMVQGQMDCRIDGRQSQRMAFPWHGFDEGDDRWMIDWSLDRSFNDNENHDRFAVEDGSGWMRRLAPLRDETMRGDPRPLYLGWLVGAAGGELRDDALEPELTFSIRPGLSALSSPQQALAEFLEIDSEVLAAAATESVHASQTDVTEADRIDSQCSVAELRELAKSASGVRLEGEAKERPTQEAERHRQREACLRLPMAHVDKRWDAIHEQAQRGSASGYEQATRALAELSEGYAPTASRETFDHAPRRFLMRHATRPALLRRMSEAGVWSG